MHPLKLICDKRARKNGATIRSTCSIVSVQQKEKLLPTAISIPIHYWNAKKSVIKPDLPVHYGEYTAINKQLPRMVRVAGQLIDIAAEKKLMYLIMYARRFVLT